MTSWYDIVMILEDYFQKQILYCKKMEIDEIDGNSEHIYRLKKIYEIL